MTMRIIIIIKKKLSNLSEFPAQSAWIKTWGLLRIYVNECPIAKQQRVCCSARQFNGKQYVALLPDRYFDFVVLTV